MPLILFFNSVINQGDTIVLCHPDFVVKREPVRPLAAERLGTEAGRSAQCQTDSQYFARLLTTGGKVFTSAQNSLQLQQRGPFKTLCDSRSISTRCRLSAERHIFWYQLLADIAELLLTIILQTNASKKKAGTQCPAFDPDSHFIQLLPASIHLAKRLLPGPHY